MRWYFRVWIHTLCIVFLLVISSCDEDDSRIRSIEGNDLTYGKVDSVSDADHLNAQDIDTISVMVVPCANGYEYAMSNFDLDPLLETALSGSKSIQVIPFPLKTMMGVAYQGVFDAKYCPPIIEKVAVDYLVLSRFDKEYHELNRTTMSWGYEVRIINTQTLEQVNSIEAHNLEEYAQIEQHIKANIGRLVADLGAL